MILLIQTKKIEKKLIKITDITINKQGDNEFNIQKKYDTEKSIEGRTEDLIKNNILLEEFSSIYSKQENIKKIISSDNDLKESILSQIKRENNLLDDLGSTIDDSHIEGKTSNEKEQAIRSEIEVKIKELKKNEDFIGSMVAIYSQKEALKSIIGESYDNDDTLIDKLNVTPGYENALDALLGDELYYSTNEKNPIYWKLLDEIEEGHELPNSCEPLSNYVKGSDALKRRLNQTGINIISIFFIWS